MASALGRKRPHIQLDIRVFAPVEPQGHPCAAELADHRSHRRTGGAGQRLAKGTKDEQRVQQDVDPCAHQLADHAQVGAAGSSQQLFRHHLHKHTGAAHAADLHIKHALAQDLRVCGLGLKIRLYTEKTHRKKGQKAAQRQKQPVLCHLIGLGLVLLAQALGQQGVDAHAGTDAHSDHHILQRERQGNCGQCTFADVGHEHRVHHIVQRLYQHRRSIIGTLSLISRGLMGMVPMMFSAGADICLVLSTIVP